MRLILAAVALGARAVVAQSSCKFWFPDEAIEFDLSSLTTSPSGNYWDYHFGMAFYSVSFCSNIQGASCAPGSLPSASMAQKPGAGGCQQSFGVVDNTTAKLLATDPSQGLTLIYGGGPPICSDLSASYSVVNLRCDPTTAFMVTGLTILQQNCAIEIDARSRAACPYRRTIVVNSLGAGWIAAIAVIVSLTLYCAVGAGVKRYRRGTSGIESVPHIDTLRKVRGAVMGALFSGPPASTEYYAAAGDDGEFFAEGKA